MIRKLDWDSDFFGLNVGEWIYDGTEAEPKGFDILYVKSNKAYMPAISGFVPRHSEGKVVFTKNIQGGMYNENVVDFIASGLKASALYELAYESGKYSRFNLDKKFGRSYFEKLYGVWVDNSVSGKFATRVLVYIDGSIPVGFVTYKIEDCSAAIGLIAVLCSYQGQGIGKKLLNYVEADLFEKKIQELHIPTQLENGQACRFYKKQGYTITEITYITHYWKDDTI